MIYITGDCHGDYTRLNMASFPEQKGMSKDDYVIVCGDFGYWDASAETKYWMNWLEHKSFTTLWVDGNHENYDLLKEIPVEEWHGGRIQRVMPSVIHLMRGQVYELEGLKIFTFGGARSHDMEGGLLYREDPAFKRKKARLVKAKKTFRIVHENWWPEEMPDEDEFEEGRRNLARHDWQVDVVLTHCCATSVQEAFDHDKYAPDQLTDYLEEIRRRTKYRYWLFGHYHENRKISGKDYVLYEQVVRLSQQKSPVPSNEEGTDQAQEDEGEDK